MTVMAFRRNVKVNLCLISIQMTFTVQQSGSQPELIPIMLALGGRDGCTVGGGGAEGG